MERKGQAKEGHMKARLAKLGVQARSELVRRGPPGGEAGAHAPCVIRSLRSGPLANG